MHYAEVTIEDKEDNMHSTKELLNNIESLENMTVDEWCNLLGSLKKLIELRNPTSPNNVDNRWFTCPNCGHGFNSVEHGESGEVRFCTKCGKAINW